MNPPEVTLDTVTFDEPWEAQIFALVVASHEAGLFTWPEWSSALGGQSQYGYRAWTAALEQLLMTRDIARTGQVSELAEAWHRAAEATPHGSPIRLENDPQRLSSDTLEDSNR